MIGPWYATQARSASRPTAGGEPSGSSRDLRQQPGLRQHSGTCSARRRECGCGAKRSAPRAIRCAVSGIRWGPNTSSDKLQLRAVHPLPRPMWPRGVVD
jgi:hypothetical protein